MNAVIVVTQTKARHSKDFKNALMLPVCHVASFSEMILIFQSVLMALEMEFIYNGKALLLISPLAKKSSQQYFWKVLNKQQKESA